MTLAEDPQTQLHAFSDAPPHTSSTATPFSAVASFSLAAEGFADTPSIGGEASAPPPPQLPNLWPPLEEMKKYGLQLRIAPQQQKNKATSGKPPSDLGFTLGDDDDDDVEKEIARQAAKKRALREVEEKHKKALEEDPSIFDYDGVYDEMKINVARPIMQEQHERKPKYIQKLLEKAKERKIEQEIIYERKLVKERSKEDHLYEDKEKFVTSAYKKKLAEQEKWKEEERLRRLHEEKEDVTKRSVSDFYFDLQKNVAFGAQKEDRSKSHETAQEDAPRGGRSPEESESFAVPAKDEQGIGRSEDFSHPEGGTKLHDAVPSSSTVASTSEGEKTANDRAKVEKMMEDSYKRNQDAVSAARERYMARKRNREHQIM